MKILISGAGIAGPALAYWLVHYGFECTIVEKAPSITSLSMDPSDYGARTKPPQ